MQLLIVYYASKSTNNVSRVNIKDVFMIIKLSPFYSKSVPCASVLSNLRNKYE